MRLNLLLDKIKTLSYFSMPIHILKYKDSYGGDFLLKRCVGYCHEDEEEKVNQVKSEFLQLLEQAKTDWQYSMKLLKETTDVDLIDYVIYLIKANEAKYRYLTKVARRENIHCELWQKQEVK